MHSTTLNRNFLQQPQLTRPIILIVDNDPDNLLFASYVIEALGMSYVVTDNSEECLQLIYQLLPEIVLLDIVMPKLNGLEITKLIKQDKNLAHISVIAVTGLTKLEDKAQLMAAGCDDYLSKPYLIEDLEAKIYQCLQNRSNQNFDSSADSN